METAGGQHRGQQQAKGVFQECRAGWHHGFFQKTVNETVGVKVAA